MNLHQLFSHQSSSKISPHTISTPDRDSHVSGPSSGKRLLSIPCKPPPHLRLSPLLPPPLSGALVRVAASDVVEYDPAISSVGVGPAREELREDKGEVDVEASVDGTVRAGNEVRALSEKGSLLLSAELTAEVTEAAALATAAEAGTSAMAAASTAAVATLLFLAHPQGHAQSHPAVQSQHAIPLFSVFSLPLTAAPSSRNASQTTRGGQTLAGAAAVTLDPFSAIFKRLGVPLSITFLLAMRNFWRPPYPRRLSLYLSAKIARQTKEGSLQRGRFGALCISGDLSRSTVLL